MTMVIENIEKSYGDVPAVKGVSLKVNEGEFLVLVGPSGCGKTTILKMLGGIIFPDKGKIYFKNRDITMTPANIRPTATVFQDYALFPHLNVHDNIAYGLKARGKKSYEIKETVEKYMEIMQIKNLKNRQINELSGGQKQRVALARALVVNPEIILFDEPLSSLDAKLRVEMRQEIKKIQRETGITAVYVTHDQEEALAIADKVAVMNDGILEQVGTPEEIYNHPKTKFVADFIGVANFINSKILKVENHSVTIEMLNRIIKIPCNFIKNFSTEKVAQNKTLILLTRPENIVFRDDGDFEGIILERSFLGSTTRYFVKVSDYEKLIVDIFADTPSIKVGSTVKFKIKSINAIYS